MARGERFIFIGSAARSGSTLLQNILDSHPDIIGGPQFRNIPDIIHLRKKLNKSIEIGKTDLFNTCDDIDDKICTLIETLLMPLLNKHKCKLLSEKTPANILVFPELMELFPGARFIRIIRDPRAAISSFWSNVLRVKKEGHHLAFSGGKLTDFIKMTNHFKKFYLAGSYSTKIAPERVLTVVYERLVINPEDETRKICKFLEIEWCPDMLYPSRKRHIGEKASTQSEGIRWHPKEDYHRDIDTNSIDKWKKQLKFLQKVLILVYFKDIKDLVHHGYNLSTNSRIQKALITIISCLKKLFQNLKF